MAYIKGNHGSSSGGNRGRPYALMLLLAFGAALLGVMVLHKLRERRIYNLLVKEKDRDLLALQLLLQKERDRTKEMKRKNEEMKAKIYSLRTQKMELDRRVLEMKSTMDSLKEEQKVMESAFEEKQNEIRMLQEKGSDLGKENPEIIALKEKLREKEAEIEDLKHRFEVSSHSRSVSSNDSTILPESVSENRKMAAQEKTQTENKETEEQSHDQATKYESSKGITNEEASKSKLIKFGVEDQIQKRKGNNDGLIETEEQIKKQEILEAEGAIGVGTAEAKITDGEQGNVGEVSQGDDGAGVTAKEMDEKIVGKENATIKKERGQFENNTNGGGQDFSMKQLENNSQIHDNEKRKHVRLSKTKGKRWRMTVKDVLGNNGISESHGALNKRSGKVNKDEQDELKDKIDGKVSNDEKIKREEEEMDSNNPSKDKAEAKLQKPGSHDDIPRGKIKMENDINHQMTDSDIGMHQRKQKLDEVRQSEKQEESGVEQSWSRRHINIVEKNARHEETGMLREEPKAANIQEQEKDAIDGGDDEDNDDFSKASQHDSADEKEYKEEIDESVFQAGL